MRRLLVVLLSILALFLIGSCATTTTDTGSTQFSLNRSDSTSSEVGIMFGTVNYGAGFFFPSANDILDISVLKTDPITGLVTEISHQRIRNLLNFPVQFTVRYDKADLLETDTCSIIVSLIVDDNIKAQGITLLQRNDSGFVDASLTLITV